MKNNIYSTLLVSLQFLFITLLILNNASIFSNFIASSISIVGFCLGLYAIRYNRINNFNIKPELKHGAELITKGPYKYVRHPMYTALFLIMLGVVLADINLSSLFLYIGFIIVLYLKARKEEILLLQHFRAYKEYKGKTKMFIPFIL